MAGRVELRVHGVSGTSAQALLGVTVDDLAEPPPAGDAYVTFNRLRDQGPPEGPVLEGMSWGRLTSGAVVQALWLLLLPFAIANLAYWARPWEDRDMRGGIGGVEAVSYRGAPRLASLYRVLVRAISLGLTATIVYTAAAMSLDLVAWQCWVTGTASCSTGLPLMGWLPSGASWPTGTALTVGVLVPLLVVAGLSALSARATLQYETFRAEDEEGDGSADPHLFSRRMWHGDVLVARLRHLHVAVGLTTVAIIAARMGHDVGLPVLAVVGASVLVVAASALIVVLVASPDWLQWSEQTSPTLGRLARPLVLWAPAVVALGIIVVTLLAVGPAREDLSPDHAPGLVWVGHGIVLTQILLLAVHVRARRELGPRFGLPPVPDRPSGRPVSIAAGGLAGWLIATMSVVLAFAYSAGAVFRTAQVVGAVPLPAFGIAASGAGLFTLVAAAWVVVRGAPLWRRREAAALVNVEVEYRSELGRIFPDRPVQSSDYRITRVARPRALASIVSFDLLRGLFVLAAVVGIGTGLYAGLNAVYGLSAHPDTPPLFSRALGGLADALAALQPLGSWVVTLFALGLIAAGVAAWRSQKARRLVGIVWDVSCFWPRAAHPFAPPCYSERAIPQLACRLSYLADRSTAHDGAVVLAGHSQGSIISIATMAQLTALGARDPGVAQRGRRIALMTFGCPLLRLYTPVFPRLFWPTRMHQLGVCVQGRWTNLWRSTDPIGSSLQPVLSPAADDAARTRPGDVRLVDPSQLAMVPDRSAYAPVHGHVDYDADPAYAAWVALLAEAARRDGRTGRPSGPVSSRES